MERQLRRSQIRDWRDLDSDTDHADDEHPTKGNTHLAMPVAPMTEEKFLAYRNHRTKNGGHSWFPFNAAVARPVTKREIAGNVDDEAAIAKELHRFRNPQFRNHDDTLGVWDENSVREWKDVAACARRGCKVAHMGHIFGITVLKGSEFLAGDPRRKYKHRVVFQGSWVKDQVYNSAMFQELGSCPATMEASRAADCRGCIPGNDMQQSDAEQAYVQAELIDCTQTWVALPRDQWPQKWIDDGMQCPVCILKRALYGHPDSGGHWENHCEKQLIDLGYQLVGGWGSCYYNPTNDMFLVAYVDDFKLAGPSGALPQAWKDFSSKNPPWRRRASWAISWMPSHKGTHHPPQWSLGPTHHLRYGLLPSILCRSLP